MQLKQAIFTLLWAINLFKIVFSGQCPQLQTYHNPMLIQNYIVKNFLRIPKTNILIINTIFKDNYDSSIVYYNDLSSPSGEIINVIKPNFVIIDMQYNIQSEQIMVTNYDNLIFADPYTLKAITSFPVPNLYAISLVDQTNYIILTNFFNTLQIYDYIQQKLMLTMDNSKTLQTFANNTYLYQYYSDFYTLSTGQTIILTTNDMGIITWTIDLKNLVYKFNGYIKQSIVKNQGDNYRSYTKHPTQDIFFIGGQWLEIIIVKVIDITKNQFKQIYKISLYNYQYSDPISNLRYIQVQTNNGYQPILWLGAKNYIYNVTLSESPDSSSITTGNFYYQFITTYGRWYMIQENPVFYISSEEYVTIFNYQTQIFSYNLYFYSDLYCRRFIRQQQGQIDQFILLSYNQIKLYDRGNFGISSKYQKNALAGNVRWIYGSFYKVKNTFDYYFVKNGQDGTNSQIFLLPIYPLTDNGSIVNITSLYNLYWKDINQNLDPFYLNNSYLVAFAFPKKAKTENYLFMLIDCTSQQKKQYLLKSDLPNDNLIQTAFAIASLENQNNLELIGVDNLGTVYSWDLSKNGFPFKFRKDFSFCQNSLIGDIFHYNDIKRLIISCDNNKVYSFNYTSGDYQLLVQLSQQPFALRAFSKPKLVAIGDFNTGIAYIFKFNIISQQFDLLLNLQSSKIQDQIINIEMLQDNTIWVQFTYSNLFYSLNDCLQDSNLCIQCTQQYSFYSTDQYDSSGVYGVGTKDQPFTTSNNFLTAMIKAQYYKQIVSGVSNMFVDILVVPNRILNLNSKLMNFDFNSIISLNFKSTQIGSYASLQYQNRLEFINYNYVGFQDIIIYFGLDDENNKCGLYFSNIENNVLINNIQLYLYSATSKPLSCQSIYSDSSVLNVQNYQISGEDFTNHGSVLQYFNVTDIFFNNFSLTGCTLGNSFSILTQESNLKVAVSNVTLASNVCPTDDSGTQNNQKISALFSAGGFNVKNMTVNDNIFCKKIVFSVVSSLDQDNQVFSFQDIQIYDNLFQARTTYLFFDALYSMMASPSHELDLNNIQFKNNSLTKYNDFDQISASYFQTSKISKIQAQSIMLINHFDISFGFFQYLDNINVINFNCVNDDDYLVKIPNQQTYSCLQLNEFASANITQIKIINKKAQDTNLLQMENNSIQSANLIITKGVFQNLQLYQNGVNTEAIPIQVASNYQIEITIDTCLFQNITLKSIQFTLTYSTSALWIQNYVGKVLIKNSQFYDSYSNSQYGLIFVQANQLTLDTVQFSNATFSLNQPLPLFNSYGAMLNVKAQTVNILKSGFNQATAIKGAFLYMISFGQIFQVSISDTIFSEGYAEDDGGAIYIDSGGQQLQFNCQNCQFSNIYTQQISASTIGQEKYSKTKTNQLNKIQFQGGFIKNVFGVTDNYFIDISNSNLQFNQIPTIISEQFNSNSLPQQLYLTKFKGLQQQATLVNLLKSSLQIQGCKFSNIKIQSQTSLLPLLISSTLSNITITNTQFEDSLFSGSAIYALQSNVQFENISFKNVSQALFGSRVLQQNIYQNPDPYGASLIISYQSTVSIKSKSSFTDSSCKFNCNGGAIQLFQSTLTLEDTTFQNIDSSFGGALFVQGMNNSNTITNTRFINCRSQNDGGALYLKALQKDKFGLSITNSIFESNSCKTRGGAIYIDSDVMNSPLQSISIADSKIIQNVASIGGGIFQQNISVNTEKNNVISSNKGTVFGNDNISYPTKLRISNIDEFLQVNNGKVDKDQIVINNFRSGANLTNIQFLFLNDKNEIIYPITQDEFDTYKISVAFDPKTANLVQYQIDGSTQASFNPNIKSFSFENITLLGKPGSSVQIQFSSKQIYGVDSQQANFVQNYTFNILVHFRLCDSGEQIAQLGQVTECQICPANYYSFNVENCQECPKGATCNGGTDIVTNQGYWRKSNISDLIISCSNLPDNCDGGNYGDDICHEGHIGALCEECDIYGQHWGTSYAKSAKYSCTRCDQIKGNIWIVVLMTVWTLISMCLAIKGDVEILKERVAILTIQKSLKRKQMIKSQSRRQTSVHQVNQQSFNTITNQKTTTRSSIYEVKEKPQKVQIIRTDEEKSGIYIKMLTNYVQIVGSIATFNLSIPSGIFEFPQSVGQPLKQTMNSLDCALQEMNSSMPIIYMRLLFSILIPFLYMALFLICMGLYYLLKKIKAKKNNNENQFPWYILATAIMFLIIYVQPDLVAQIIALLSCRQIGDTQYILSNVSFVCYDKEHYFYALVMVIPMLLVWVLILPGILFMSLRKNKNRLEEIDIKLKYGFLYKEYENYAFYWEFVKMTEKLAIILALNFYSQSINIKAILVFVVITVYGILSIIIKPYQESDVNEIDVNSTHVCALTVLLGLFMYKNQYVYFVYSSLGLIVMINLWFIVKILNKIIGGYMPKIKDILQQLVQILSSKISYFKRFVKQEENAKKKMDPEIKKKFLFLFQKFQNLNSEQKKKIVMEVYEQRLVKQYAYLFDKNEENEEQKGKDEENFNQLKSSSQFCGTLKFITQQEEDKNIESGKQNSNQEILNNIIIHKKEDSNKSLIKFDSQESPKSDEENPNSKFYIESQQKTLKEDQVNIEIKSQGENS
ncbi:transmembrane protein, putative (macronuclear) [Tetrahymena thermophila SB210]|uniref:Transmembrane protein, putative n=1 Tax=Tetrahymena thermophila (strain SB210) TaxID=312017 RepID=Q232D9_TETTS|nr:transmembrane protein, putative [Tetrahymena thermophila SB210]EAR91473.2 transmembrane protein, putative [Tetrahymena thermophila SB210]|eukprot:XP_001011718.2 transmembrane protein, putative [Tetrahymena thermophila SB210]